MKYAWMAAILLCVVASGAWAQSALLTARSLGMGGTGIAIADDGAAWFQNPAGLACLNVPAKEGNRWGSDAIGTYVDFKPNSAYNPEQWTGGESSSWQAYGATWSSWQPEKDWGVGAGVYYVPREGTFYGAGIGNNFGKGPISWGANFATSLPRFGGSETITNVGALYRAPRFRLGVIGDDILGRTQDGPFLDAGVALPLGKSITLAVDVLDVTGKSFDGARVSGGVEWQSQRLALRGGFLDTSQFGMDSGNSHEFTVGAGYKFNRFRVDAGWANVEDGLFAGSVGFNF